MTSNTSAQFILKKISKQGRVYYFKGTVIPTDNGQGEIIIVAETGYLIGDAHVFTDQLWATWWAEKLNEQGIGGADWIVERVVSDDLVTIREDTPIAGGVPIPPENADECARFAVEGGRD
ncbi:MAG: hypothetical protein N4A65_01155 [Cohaesibacter sp.]|jgi:hypothetical protein|nr:hypothetical protein [Cohaesibacter sp.]